MLILVSPVVIFGLACSTSEPTATPTGTTQDTDQVAQSASYRIELPIGSVVTMMEFTEMSTMDQGQPVNHHLDVHIFDASSGAVVMDVIPVVSITNQATGVSREMETGAFSRVHANVMAWMVSKHRVSNPHFGDNLYLADGTYTISVGIGDETVDVDNIDVRAPGSSGM